MAWIDYQKAYDSVPHSWIMKCLEMYKINTTLRNMIQASMKLWTTTLTFDKQDIGEVRIRRGIFQGDALSPLLFCLALNPLSEVLKKVGNEYTLANGSKINHLLYMDDLKLYSKKEAEINSLIHTTKTFSNDIKMKFGFQKCARLIINRGKVKDTQGLQIEEGIIHDTSKDGYKYLGIPQHRSNIEHEAKEKAKKEYKKRLRQILKSRLNAKYKIDAINIYAIPVISYTGGIVKWTVQEMEELNRKTRKMINMYKGLHPRSDVDRLYLPRRLGGRGLKNIRDVLEGEDRSFNQYIWNNTNDPLLAVVKADDVYRRKPERFQEWKTKKIEIRQRTWHEKPLHGQYPRQTKNVTTKDTQYRWLKEVKLKIET